MSIPGQLEQDLRMGMEAAGIPLPESKDRWQAALRALKVKLGSSSLSTNIHLCASLVRHQCHAPPRCTRHSLVYHAYIKHNQLRAMLLNTGIYVTKTSESVATVLCSLQRLLCWSKL